MTAYEGILNPNFIQCIEKDMKTYDILYIYAPFGWGKEVVMKTIYNDLSSKDVCWLEYKESESLEQQIAALPKAKKRIYMIPNLEVIVEQGQQDLIWDLMSKKNNGDVFVIASSALLPAKMLPYTLLNRYISYGIEEIKPSSEDVSAYMKKRGISLSKEELFQIEKDCNNLPVYVRLLANLLENTNRRYGRNMKERCFEDLFSYIDVMFFRSFQEEDQNAMLKLSCLERFDNRLISYMLDISRKEADEFVERLLIKSSVLEKINNGWRFFPVMKLFLERAIHKYLDYEERLEDYHKAMDYLLSRGKWLPAMRFAYILQDKEEIANCLDHLMKENVDYSDFVTLEEYFRELTTDILMKHPDLMIAGSILKATIGDTGAARKHEKLYLQLIENTEDEKARQKMQVKLLFMYMSRPGMMRDDVLEISTELLEALGDSEILQDNQKFEPHYVSVLRGEKDYCKYFKPCPEQENVLEKLHEVADKMNDHTFSMMLSFMEAEVLYERNELDRALDGLVKISREAKIMAHQRMQQLCTIAMVDLLAVKNQMNSTETFKLERLETEGNTTPLFGANCQAHIIYYHLLKNEKEPILRWMKDAAPDESERFLTTQHYQYLIKAKVYLWMGQYVRARMILQVLMDYAVQYKMAYLEAQVRILEAAIYYIEGSSLWKETLLLALKWAKELGFIRVFADEGAVIYELLNRIAQEEKEWANDTYFKKLLTATKAQMLQYPKYLKQEKQGEIGEFSESEQAVMRLLVHGDKNADIANQLCVSENTVKYHLKNIYQKLQVKSRSQAISKIREYELL